MVGKPLRLAVDTNVLLDVALVVDDVLDCLAVLDQRLPHAEKFVPPSVLDELAHLSDSGETDRVRGAAQMAIRQLREERHFRPILEVLASEETVDALAGEIRERGLLPETEIHDSLILAETAFLTDVPFEI